MTRERVGDLRVRIREVLDLDGKEPPVSRASVRSTNSASLKPLAWLSVRSAIV
jgi:hypothetical protein